MDHPPEFSDTDPKVLEVWFEMLRRMPLGQKLRMALDSSQMMMAFASAGVRLQYPNASEREIFLRSAARRLDRDTMINVYGWDPQSNDPPS
jgi:hypothetical protein